jgi:MFS family permease
MGLLEGIQKNVIILGIVSFLTDVSSEMIFPILPLFLTNILGVGKEIIGLIEGIADSISSLFDIFVGYFSDVQGKRREFVIAGYGLSAILKFFLVFANTWQPILVIRGAERLGKSIRTSPRDAIIAESSDEKVRGTAFGLHRAMDTLGAITGPAIAYLILRALGEVEGTYRTIFLIATIPAFLAVAAIIFFVREPKPAGAQAAKTKPAKARFWDALRAFDSRYKRFLFISCLFSLAYFSFALLIVRANDIGMTPEDILLVYLLYNVVYFLVSVPAGWLSDKVGRKPVIAASFILYGLICIGFIFLDQPWQIAALFAVYGVFVATDESVNKAYISDMTTEEKRGMALGAYNSAVAAVYLPANAIFGAVWAVLGVAAAFSAAAAVSIAAGIAMFVVPE